MITDLDDNPLPSAHLSIPRSGVKDLQMKVDCRSGLYLRCDTVANLLVQAKHSAAGAYGNLETTPIDLTPWAGTRQIFDFKLTASNVTATENFRIYAA